MGSNFNVAWRNIWRNKRRTLITAAAVGFSCAILVFFMSLQYSSYDTAINATTRVYQGHLQVQVKGYLDKPQFHLSIPEITKLRKEIEALADIEAATARAIGFALMSSKMRSYGVQVVGVEPEREKKISSIPGLISKGGYLNKLDAHEAVVGASLAKNLRVSVGDELTMLGQGKDASLAVGVLKVVGIFESGSYELDRNLLQIPLKAFGELFNIQDAGHHIAVIGKAVEDVEKLKNDVAALLDSKRGNKELVALTWEALSPGLKQSIELDMASGWLFYVSLVIIVAFSVLNTFLMSLLERTREFGVLLALGMNPLRIAIMLIEESLMIIVTGLIPGILLGAAFIVYFGHTGFYIPGSEDLMKLWNLPGKIYPYLSVASLSLGPGLLMISSLFAVLIPAFRILKLEAVEAMRAT